MLCKDSRFSILILSINFLLAGQDRFRHLNDPVVFFDIVYADKGASAEHADHGGGKCSFHALIYRQIQGVADDRFSGSAEKNREPEFLQDIYMIDGFRFCSYVFPKPTPGSSMILSSGTPALCAIATHSFISATMSSRKF